MKPPQLTPLEQKAVDVWKEKVYEGYGDTKHLEECDWGDMAIGWLMAYGCSPKRAAEISAHMRYVLGIA